MNLDQQALQQTLAELLKIGGQYFLPAAALLRALYAGVRGKMPEGFREIALAGILAGVVAAVTGEPINVQAAAVAILSNTAFTVGVLVFIVLYLLRMPNRGLVADGIVGGVLGLIVWLFTVYVLGEAWPWWLIPLLIVAGAAIFIILRFSLRQIMRLVRVATYLIAIGLVLVVGAGAFLLVQTLTQPPALR
ncbi:MAG: hypothetical protein HXY41_02620 [Chloroflexi bacterium]|nr:hypothetical protein [Chloroflexota bacterium]